MLDALRACNWNRVRAAEILQMPRRTFYRRLKEYGIQLLPPVAAGLGRWASVLAADHPWPAVMDFRSRRRSSLAGCKGLLGPRFPCDARSMVSWRVWSLGLWAVVSLACAQAANGDGGSGGDGGDTGAAGDDSQGGDGGGGDGGSGGAGTGGVSGKGGSGGQTTAGKGGTGGSSAGGAAGSAQAGGGAAGSPQAGAGGTPEAGSGGSSPGMLDGSLSKPPPSATSCMTEGELGGECAAGLVCRIYSEHEGRCEGCNPCTAAGKACTASVQCDIDSQCYGGVCRELCSTVKKVCKKGGSCKNIGNDFAGVCVP
jgi:hypothetical protein